MRLDEEYCLSEYVDLGRLGDNEKVHIVRNQVNGVIGVRKYVALDLEEIYLFLKENPNAYIPKIYECIQTDTNLIVIEEYLSGKNLEEMLKETIYTQSLATIEETSFKKLVVCYPFAWKALKDYNYPEEKMVYFADILY